MIDLSTINLLSLPSLALEQCRQLPDYSGIYFVLSASDDILYIGCSINLQERWIVHHRYQQFQEIGNIRISWLQVIDASQLNVLEQELISYFNPLLNKRRILKDGKTSQHKWNDAEMLNPNTKLYISSYTNFKKPKIVNMTSSPQTNEHS